MYLTENGENGTHKSKNTNCATILPTREKLTKRENDLPKRENDLPKRENILPKRESVLPKGKINNEGKQFTEEGK